MRRTIQLTGAVLLLVSLTAGNGLTSSAPGSAGDNPGSANAPGVSPRILRYHADFGTAEVVSGQFTVSQGQTKLEKVYAFVGSRPESFKIARPGDELRLLSEETDKLGLTHLRFQQIYNGLPVWGCRTIVHFKDDQTIYLVGGQTIATPALNTTPVVTADVAASNAVDAVKNDVGTHGLKANPELLIYPNNGDPRLAYLVTITGPSDGSIRWRVFVEAQTGDILFKFNDVPDDGPDTGSGPDVHNVTRTFPIYFESGQYKMRDVSRTGQIITFENMYDGGPISTDPDGDKVWDDNPGQKAAVSGHVNAALTYDYFLNTFGRDSYDGLGSDVVVNVHDSVYVNNAYWNGYAINFADGDGVNYLPFSGSLDVTAHELSHGVTEYTAGLIYAFQSGALNESYSDVFGACVDRDDWLLGEEIRISAPGFIRSMESPSLRGQPEHMNDYRYLGMETDNGGVHINSGIPNFAFYWASFFVTRDTAEQVWYRALTQYLTPNSDMYFWSAMILQSAADLYGYGGAVYDDIVTSLMQVGLNGTYISPTVMDIPGVIGSVTSDSIYIHNPAPAAEDITITLPPTLSLLTPSATSFTLPGNDSALVVFACDASGLDSCDVGLITDTIVIAAVPIGASASNILVPVDVAVGYTAALAQSVLATSVCLELEGTTTSKLSRFAKGGVDILYDGSLLVGVKDGADTTTYRDVFGVTKFAGVDTVATDSTGESFRISSGDGRVQGTIKYSWYTGGDSDSCDFIIAQYSLKNICDTTLTVYPGLFSDFDIGNSGNNVAAYDASRQLVYMEEGGGTRSAGFALLSGTARNLRAILNPNLVWNGKFKDGAAYKELAATSNVSGASPDDYSILLTFGQAVLSPGTTADYAVALVYSQTGTARLGESIDLAKAYWEGPPPYTEGDANGDGSANVADAVYLINYVFKGGPAPDPLAAGDANCDGSPNVADAVYLINYVFKGGAAPGCP